MKLSGKTQADIDVEKHEKALAECRINRLNAYRDESDPLFFKWQRGEATQEEWLSKIAEIKSRYPK